MRKFHEQQGEGEGGKEANRHIQEGEKGEKRETIH